MTYVCLTLRRKTTKRIPIPISKMERNISVWPVHVNKRYIVGTIVRNNRTELLGALTAKVVQKDRIESKCGWYGCKMNTLVR